MSLSLTPSHTTKPAALAMLGGSWSSGGFARRVRRAAVRTPAIGMSGVFTSGVVKAVAKRGRRGTDVLRFNGYAFDRSPMTAEERAEFPATPRAS